MSIFDRNMCWVKDIQPEPNDLCQHVVVEYYCEGLDYRIKKFKYEKAPWCLRHKNCTKWQEGK